MLYTYISNLCSTWWWCNFLRCNNWEEFNFYKKHNLTFKKYIDNLVRKAQYKLHALRRIRKFLTIEKAKILGNAFVDSQFSNAPLTWMFRRETLYSKIEKTHHMTLKVVSGVDDSYNNLLLSSNSVSIHQRHLRFLVTEVFKAYLKSIQNLCGYSKKAILQFRKKTNSKSTKYSVHLIRHKWYSL